MNLQPYAGAIATVLVGIFVITNTWMLKLYEHRRTKGAAAATPNNSISNDEKRLKRLRLVNWVLFLLIITSCIFRLREVITHPGKEPNRDAFVIAQNIALMCFIVFIIVMIKMVDFVCTLYLKHAAVTKEIVLVIEGLYKTTKTSNEIHADFAKQLATLTEMVSSKRGKR